MKRVLVIVVVVVVSTAVCLWVARSSRRGREANWARMQAQRDAAVAQAARNAARKVVLPPAGAPRPVQASRAAAQPAPTAPPPTLPPPVEPFRPVPTREYPNPESSVVLNEICYHPPGGARADEWIEIANRSLSTVDLSGWKLARGVELTLPAGTRLEPGHCLVLAADRVRLETTLGVRGAMGDWTGSLDDGGELIELLAADGKKVDALRYDDRPPFPALADGLGSTLERRSPHAPSASPANWGSSTSRTAAGGGWEKLTGTGVPTSNRLYVYLQAPGQAWIDDLTVRDSRGRVVFRDDFESKRSNWNAVGQYSAAASALPSTMPRRPDSREGERGLLVTGPAAGSGRRASVYIDVPGSVDGNACTVELWAHLPDPATGIIVRFSGAGSGTPGLSIERSGQRQSRAFSATPGRANSIETERLPPFAHPLAISPARPGPNDTVTVRARLESAEPLAQAALSWQEWGKPAVVVPLVDDGDPAQGEEARSDGVWSGRFGPFPAGTLVLMSLAASGAGGQTAAFPLPGNPSRQVGFIVEPLPRPSGVFPHYEIFLAPEAVQALDANPFTDTFQTGVLVHDGRVWSDVGFRYRGHTSRGIPKHHWKVKLPKDHPLALAHGGREVGGFNLQSAFGDPTYVREVLSYGLWRDLGEASCEAFHSRVSLNGAPLGLYIHLENPGRDFLKRNRLEQGWLWKAYSDGYGGGSGFELECGDESTARATLDGFLGPLLTLRGDELDAFIRDRMEVDSFINYLAACQVVHSADHVQKNYLLHASPAGKFSVLPWDMDLTHGRNYECDGGGIWNDTIRWDMWDRDTRDDALLFGTQAHPKCDGWVNLLIDAFLRRTSTFRPRYHARVAEILARYYHPDILLPKLARWRLHLQAEAARDLRRWPGFGGASFDQAHRDLERWTRRRFEHLQAKLKVLGVQVAPPLNADFAADVNAGSAPLRVAFRNLAAGAVDVCEWDFGDGQKSVEREPVHSFASTGRYDVTLKVTGTAGTHVQRRREFVHVRK